MLLNSLEITEYRCHQTFYDEDGKVVCEACVKDQDLHPGILQVGFVPNPASGSRFGRFDIMNWELCIQYANGTEKTLQCYSTRDSALNHVDQLYSKWGYPLHFAYIVRPKVAS